MTLVDTSTLVDHMRRMDARVQQLSANRALGVHPFVIGEILCGNFRNRRRTIEYLYSLPQTLIADEADVHRILESHELWGRGINWVDLHLLASAALAGWTLLTSDHALHLAARKLGIAYPSN